MPKKIWYLIIGLMIAGISLLHYTTPTMHWQYHLLYMQCYFIPILIAAFKFGFWAGFGTALTVSFIYLPHIMLQWGGLIDTNLMRFLQIILFNIVGMVTGYLAEREFRERRRYQATAEELDKNLSRVRHQSEKLSELEEQLRLNERLAVVGELTASLAHELRNPLGTIRGAVEIIRDEVPDNMKRSEWLQILIDETKRLDRVVENYLNFAAKRKSEKKRYNVNEVLSNAGFILGKQFEKHNIALETELPQQEVYIYGDSSQLWQVVMNLLLNAQQAMESPGSTSITLKIENNNLYISIRDQGRGIDKRQQENIFKPFYTTRKNGTGLGLAIVRRIIDDNGWTLGLESKPGQGSTFTITIPYEDKN